MKKFIIKEIKAADVGNLSNVNVKSNGENIVVTGQNGAGKSTLAKTILWTLAGATADGEKLIPVNGNGLPCAEVKFTDGTVFTKFRKEMIQKVARGVISRTTDCFLNDLPVNQRDLQEYFKQYVPVEMFDVLIGLGKFFKLKPAEQRQILTNYFGNVTDEEVRQSDAELSTLDLNGNTAENYEAVIKQKAKQIKAKMVGIPKAIAELERQTVEVEDDRGIVKVQILALETELHEITRKIVLSEELRGGLMDLQKQAGQATSEYWQLRKDYDELKTEIAGLEREVENLRGEYMTPPDTCPTCGQRVNLEQVEKIREKIARDGKALSEKIESDKLKLTKALELGKAARVKMDELNAKLKLQDFDSTEYDAAVAKRGNLQRGISERQAHIAKIDAQLELNSQNESRIGELKKQEKTFGKQLSELDRTLALLEKLTLKKMKLVTDKINSQFQFVKFKMFEILKNGDVKNTCIATLDGVPYDNLSKGEKLKVALDVLNAFQKCFGVMFPLIIDDAESYTSNSLIEIPNQKILLKAVEGAELEINCGNVEGKKSA